MLIPFQARLRSPVIPSPANICEQPTGDNRPMTYFPGNVVRTIGMKSVSVGPNPVAL